MTDKGSVAAERPLLMKKQENSRLLTMTKLKPKIFLFEKRQKE
jgi:hypothetical protein